jgi:tRNA(Ile)-lysidine synthase
MRKWRMTEPGQRLLVAVSGGADSTALLYLMHTLSEALRISLGIVHLNHGLRGSEARRDERFVAAMADDLGLSFHSKYADARKFQREQGLSPEEAARTLRYRYFDEILDSGPYDRLATGHNADDNAEQVLLGLTRGSGPRGLSGIPPVRSGRIIRPLICVKRRDVEKYLASRKIAFVADTSNDDPAFMRNRIRHQIMPMLRRLCNPSITDTINRTSRIMRDEEDWLGGLASAELDRVVTASAAASLSLNRNMVNDMHPALRRRVFRAAIAAVRGNMRRLSWSHVDSIDQLARNARSRKHLDLPGQVRLVFTSREIIVRKESRPLRDCPPFGIKTDPPEFAYCLAGPDTVKIAETGGTVKISRFVLTDHGTLDGCRENRAFLDRKAVSFPITIRSIHPGDRFMPLGMTGTKKVNDFLADAKVPPKERATIPVLVSGGRIVWVAGKRIDHRVRVRSGSNRVLLAEFIPPAPAA